MYQLMTMINNEPIISDQNTRIPGMNSSTNHTIFGQFADSVVAFYKSIIVRFLG